MFSIVFFGDPNFSFFLWILNWSCHRKATIGLITFLLGNPANITFPWRAAKTSQNQRNLMKGLLFLHGNLAKKFAKLEKYLINENLLYSIWIKSLDGGYFRLGVWRVWVALLKLLTFDIFFNWGFETSGFCVIITCDDIFIEENWLKNVLVFRNSRYIFLSELPLEVEGIKRAKTKSLLVKWKQLGLIIILKSFWENNTFISVALTTIVKTSTNMNYHLNST